MQLRKVCNHPNLFEVRPTISPFRMDGIEFHVPSIVYNMLDYNPLKVNQKKIFICLDFLQFEFNILGY